MVRKLSLACVWLLAILCYVVPYWVLDQVNAWYGSFMFWSAAGVLVIICNVLATQGFREQDK
ncbi:hypothetical protein ABS755_11065 [Castellaniella sp. FW104-16D08]|uniref:hypothetical protein n=1 Tax=unclassified Castellaniella TaxID=2617606 RepID=UPI0033164B30